MPRRAGPEVVADNAASRWRVEIDMHPAQREIFEHPARMKVIAAGRRFGKSTLCMAQTIVVAAAKPGANVMWIAPAHRQARLAMNTIAKLIPRPHRDVNRTTQEIHLSTGGRIVFVSGERPDNLRGEGLDLVVIDEAAFVAEALWTQAVRPALADTLGKALLISTFFGENWFYDLYRYAINPEHKEWEGWRFPTSANPYIAPAEIAEAQRTLPKEVFAQEFEAVPTSFSGAVFEGSTLDRAWALGAELEEQVRPVCEAGLDWGHNVTALEVAVALADGRLAWMDERLFERVELSEKCDAIAAICEKYRVTVIYADAAGATENVTLAKVLARSKAPTEVQPVPFSAFKKAGIMARTWHLEHERELITPACPQLLIDSKAYHYTPLGEKPAKGNDHTVDAATALYASRVHLLGDDLLMEAA